MEKLCEALFSMYWNDRKVNVYSKNMHVRIEIPRGVDDNVVYFIAAAPADLRTSFSGSGLPYASIDQAFSNTPTKGIVRLSNGAAEIDIAFPNKFYSYQVLEVPPTLFIMYKVNGVVKYDHMKLAELDYPSRDIVHRGFKPRDFTHVKTQEAYLRDTEYPCA